MHIGPRAGVPGAAGFRRPCRGYSSLGVAAGTMLPVRDWVRRPLPIRPTARRRVMQRWCGSGREIRMCVTPSMSIRTIDGDTFEARVHLEPGLDLNTRVRLRGIDAPELKASCRAGTADGRSRDGRAARIARRRRRHDLQYRAGQICWPRRRRCCDTAHRKCFDGDACRRSCPQLRRRSSQRLVCERRPNNAQMKKPRDRAAFSCSI